MGLFFEKLLAIFEILEKLWLMLLPPSLCLAIIKLTHALDGS